MFRFLVVGCGGSGAATLTHMMDQLKSELAPYTDKIPAGWQFVSIDVPAAADELKGVGKITDLGGTYVPTSPGNGSYPVLDNAIGSQIAHSSDGYGSIATWAPRSADNILVGIQNGAGQMRSVGRMVTLNQSAKIRERLTKAFQKLHDDSTVAEMRQLAEAGIPGLSSFDANQPPVVLLVSSMAGGAGASMALDVCRLLNLVPGIEPGNIGVFMVTPDAFDSLPAHLRGGVRANALGMLGEIVAEQMVSAEKHDLEILQALGENVQPSGRAPFMRVFPVGSKVGVSGASFGDGTQSTLYRGLARGLSAMMMSGRATQEFVHYDLTNASPVPVDRRPLGWGGGLVQPDPLPWGAFGFASLSMGRDRYRHYAAQRLARTAVDRLLEGHLQRDSSASPEAQLNGLMDSQWGSVATAAGLPASADSSQPVGPDVLMQWFTGKALPQADAQELSSRVVSENIATILPQAVGRVADWQAALGGTLANATSGIAGATDAAVYRWAFEWVERLQADLIAEVKNSISRFGLPFAREFVKRVASLVSEQLTPQLAGLAQSGGGDAGRVPEDLQQELAALAGKGGNGSIANGQALTDRVLQSLRNQVYSSLYTRAAGRASELLSKLDAGVLRPLADEISEQYTVLLRAQASKSTQSGLANVHTTEYAMWPSDDDKQVPERFDVANNDVLITPSATFGDQYARDLPNAVQIDGQTPPSDEARRIAARRVITGEWPVADGYEAPGGLVASKRWLASGFSLDPRSGTDDGPKQASFEITLSPAQILQRARAYVDRRGESFDAFCSLSLADYVSGPEVPPSARQERMQDLVVKFGQAINRALPLTQVNETLVQTIHGSNVEYMFKFSDVPFGDDPEVSEALQRALNDMSSNVSTEARTTFERALKSNNKANRIDIFGSYRNYSPLVFTGLLAPAAEQWAATPPMGRRAFWEHRRSRPLQASLPMTDAERQAMISGWYLANITGRLRIPEPPYTEAVQIWDDEKNLWLDFPNPMLTSPSMFVGKQFDWLPAVLESSLLAIANAGKHPVLQSLRPYDVLASIYDRGTADNGFQGPSENIMLDHRRGQMLLAQWLESGAVPSNRPSAIAGDTKQERIDNAKQWLQMIHDFVGKEFLPGGVNGQKGTYSHISSRDQASTTPIFRDLASDIYAVTASLIEMVDRAAQQSTAQNSYGAPGNGPDAPDIPSLSIGSF